MTIYSITEIMQQHHSALQVILNKAKMLDELNNFIKPLIDPTLAPYCTVANITSNKLIIAAQNSAIATRLRFTTADLLPKIKRHYLLKSIHKITYKISPVLFCYSDSIVEDT